MKSYLKIYMKFILFILISFILISFIIAGILSFIPVPNIIYHFIVNLLAGIIMIIWGFMIVKTFKQKALWHSLLCALIFALIALLLNIDNINLINILSRPFILIATVLILSFYRRKLETK
ncbi:DUF3792 domain-containing protein [uncultured Thomasclavelia sp.]|uniref:DUF3792 domain-containing protein n=1 Tax=uncultured Thomasclavelia sp. TaxID=3025759 RepID=UPI0025E0F617|nr:DUF3792 domain-containing protein [uncultured Thomasclavelia sp.]